MSQNSNLASNLPTARQASRAIRASLLKMRLVMAAGKTCPKVGQAVSWNYAGSKASGKVQRISETSITISTGGSEVTRNGSPENPAIVIKQEKNDNLIVKLLSELS